MMIKFIILCLFVTVSLGIKSQITFRKEIGDNFHQVGLSVKQCFDNGYIITGWDGRDATFIARTNEYGETYWTKIYKNLKSCGFDVIQLPDSTFLLSGYRLTHFNNGNSGYTGNLTRVGLYGDTLPWITQSEIFGWGQALQQTYDGGIIIGGKYITKVKPSGQINIIDNLGPFQAMYIIQNIDSSYTYIIATGAYLNLIRIDESGNTIFDKYYHGCTLINPSNNCFSGTIDGGYILTGKTTSGSGIIIKTNSSGDSLWSKVLPIEYGTAVVQTPDNGYAVAGTSNGQMTLVKVDSMGLLKWVQFFGEDGDELTKSLQVTKDGGFILTGGTTKSGSTMSDVLLIKTDKNGLIYSLGNTEPSYEKIILKSFPNPTTGSLFLYLNKKYSDLTITINDITGRLISTYEYNNTDQIELELHEQGIFLINVVEQNGLKGTIKVIRL